MEQDYQTRLFGYKIIGKKLFFWSLILFFGTLISVKAQNCTINAGVLNETICATDPMILQGNNPSPIIGTVKWTQISGPSVTITSPTSSTTTVTGYAGGNTYVFRYSATCGDGVTAFQDKTVVVMPITIANAGVDIASCPNSSGSLVISGNTPQNPGETGHWEVTGSNNAGVIMNFPTSATTTITLPPNSCGTTTMTWIITGPEYAPGRFCSTSSSITITNYGGVTPITAGSDITLSNCYTTTQSVNLNASFGGCGLNGQMGTWSFVSGPNVPVFSNPNSNTNTVSNLQEGTYVLRWTVTGPCASGSDEVTITVPPATQDVTVLPGGTENIYFCDNTITQVTLSAPAPLFAGETVLWTQIGGATLPPGSIQSPSSPTTLVTNISDAGDPYRFRYTLTNSNTGCIFTKDYIVEYKGATRSISVNGGNDLYGDCEQTQFTIPITVTGTGYNRYRILDGPVGSPLGPFPTAPVQIGDTSVTLPNLTIPGTYSLQFARTEDGNLPVGCDYGFDSIAVIVSAQATPSNAGSDVSLNCGETIAPLEGVGITAQGTSYWTQLSGPNDATIVNPMAQNTTATGLVPGTYEFQYITKGGGTKCPLSTDNVTVYVSNAILTTVDAGPDQGACLNSQIALNGSIPAAGEYGQWSQVSGPDVIVFSDINNPNAVATGFLTAGATNVLRWTIGFLHPGTTGCSAPVSNDMSVVTSADMAPTVAMAGTDTCYPDGTTTINLNANTPAINEEGTWTVIPSAGVVFANINDPQTAVTIPADGTYKFTWTITLDSSLCGNSSDSVEITVAENPATAGAGPDQSVCGTTITMNATLSSGAIGVWSRVSGLGDYTISDVTDPQAVFTFERSGAYVFRWTVTAGSCSTAFDDVKILLGVPPHTANAGPDQEICNGTSVTMAGSSYDEFFEGGEWSLLAGAPNIPWIVDPMDPNTVINNLVEGRYIFRWKVTSTENFLCTGSFDDVVIEVSAPASAGSDATYCDVASVQLIGTENSTGTWTLTSGNPVGVTITQSPSNSYVANATVVPGNTYVFTYTTSVYNFTSGNTCPGTSDSVTVTVNSGASVQPDAGPDQSICITDVGGTITLAGNAKPIDVTTAEWEWVLQPGGSVANITDINNPTTQVTGLTVPGLYILKWTFKNSNGGPGGGGSCRDLSDIVRINVFQAPSQANAGPDDTVACQRTYKTNAVAPTAGIGKWSFAAPADDPSGGQVIIDSPNNPQTTLSNITALGTYTLTWTVTNGPFTNPSLCQPSVDQVSVTFNDVPPTTADAGPDQELCAVTQTNLAAVPVTQGIGTWTQTLGNPANIASPNNPTTLVFGLSVGTYEFTWTATTANNDGCSSSDTMRIEIYEQPINANAGPDQTLPQFTPVMLGATPPTVGQGKWVKISGTSSVVFGNVNSPTTTVTGLDVGTTVFEWRVTNGPCAVAADQVSITIIARTDLELTKSVTPINVNVGAVVTFTIDVFNNPAVGGTVSATGVGVKDLLPNGYTIVPGSVSNGGVYNIGDSSISWSNLNVALGTTLSLTFKATVNASGTYLNSAEVVACNQFDIDSTPNNNIPTEDDQDDATVSIQSADLSLQKSVLPTVVSIGDNVVFTVMVTNSGPNNATNVSVRDQLPVGYTYVSDTGAGAYDAGTGIWTVGTLNNGNFATLTITATVNVSSAVNGYQNIAQVITSDQNDPDSTPNNNVATEDDQDDAVVTLQNADLELAKTVTPISSTAGGVVTFTLALTNNGPGNATGVAIKDVLPNGYTLVPGSVSNGGVYDAASSTLLWQNLSLANGGLLNLTFDATVNATGTYINTAEVTKSDLPDPDSTPNNNVPTEDDQDDATVTLLPNVVDLSLTKTVVNNTLTPLVGSQISFEIRVRNSSLNTATGVQVKDLLPSGYSYVLFSSTSGTYNETSGIWDVGVVNAGTTEVLLLTVNVNPTGDYLNIAEVTSCDQPDIDSTPNNGVTTEDDYDTAIVTPIPIAADLSLTKTIVGGNTTPLVGSQISFEVIVTNSGPQDATGVQVTDSLPTGYTFTLAAPSAGTYDAGTGIWNVGGLPNGQSQTLVITATVNATGDYTNIAEVTASSLPDPDSTPNNGVTTEDDYATVTTTPTAQSADLSLTKTIVGGNTTPLIGSEVSFDIIVTNSGPQDATGVQVTDQLPSGFTYTRSSISTGTYDATTGIWNVGGLINGKSETLTISGIVNATGDYTNIAEVTASDLPDPDSTPNNGVTTEDDYGSVTVTPTNLAADLSLTKTIVGGNTTPLIGSEVSFDIIVTNSGPQDATGVQVMDQLPSGFTYTRSSISTGTYDTTTGIWNVGGLINGKSETLTISGIVNVTGDYTNIAEVTASDLPDPDSTPNNGVTTEDDYGSVIVTPTNLAADLSLTKTIVGGNTTPLIGSEVSFDIIVTNSGPQDATGVQVRDQLPSGFTYTRSSISTGTYDATTGIWNVGGLINGKSETLTISGTVNATGDYTNIAEVTASDLPDPDSTPNNGVTTEDDYGSVIVTPTNLAADLSLTKTIVGGNTTPLVGSQISFEVIVTNSGPQDATGVQVSDSLPTGYTFTLAAPSAGTYDAGTGIWNVGGLPNGQSQTLVITATVNATGDYTNIAEVTASNLPDPDSTPNNGVTTEDDYATVTTTPIAPSADLSLIKTVNITTPLVGSQVIFEIVLINNGPQDVNGVIVNDQLPSGYTFVSSSETSGFYDPTSGLWIIQNLNALGFETLKITATVNSTGDYTNVSEIIASALPDPDSTPNNGVTTEDDYATATTTPTTLSADLSLTKTIVGGNTTPLVGSQISFEIIVTNSGPQDATGVQVTDLLPTGYTFTIATPSAGTYNAGTGIWNVGGLPNGQSQTLVVTATVNATGNYTNIAEVTASSLPDPDSTPNNGDITEDDYGSVTVTPTNLAADLSLTKTIVGGNTTPLVGSEVSFDIIVTNSGPQDATGVQVTDLLPSGFTYTRSSISTGTYDAITGIWNVGGLINGKSETLTISGTVNATGNYTNIAEVTASSLPDPDSTPNNGDITEDDYGSVIVTPTNLAADLSLTKTIVGGNTTPLVGSEVSFDIIVTNSGPQDATGVQVTDLLPSGFTYTRSSISTGTYDAITGIWNVGGLINGKSETLTISGTVNATGNYTNIAEVTASSLPDPDSTPNNGDITEDDYGSVTVTPTNLAADLSLTKTIVGGNTTPLVGSEVSFDIIVTNSGPQDATGVQVTDLLPSGFTYTRSSISTGTYDAITGIWNVGGLINGKSETLTISGTVNATGNYTNIAEVTASSLPDPDSTPNNGVTTEDDYGSVTVTPTNLAADLSLTKTIVGGNTTPLVGSQISFEIIVTNSGPQDATGVQVTDLLPTGYTFTIATPSAGTYNAGTGIWNVGGLPNGQSQTLVVTATVNATGDYTNIAEVTASSLPDPDSTPNNGVTTEDDYGSVIVTPTNLAADLSLTKTIVGGNTTPLVGSEVSFDIIVTNSGPQDATGVQVTDLLPSGFTYIRSSISTGTYDAITGIWNVGGLINGKSETLTISGTVNATGNYTNIAEVTASSLPDPDSTPNNGDITEDDYGSVIVTPTNLAADLSLTKTIVGGNTTPLVGSEVSFDIIVTNSGPQDATGVQVTDQLPSGFTYTRSSISTGTYDAITGIWNVGGLINGKSETLTISGTVNATGNYTNIAEVTASSLPDPDSTPNNGVTTEDDYGSVTVIPTNLAADLSLTKTIVGGNTTPLVGSEVSFDIIVTNSGPQDATGVQVTDLLPSGFTYTRSSISTGTYDAITGIWNVGGLINGKSETLTISGTVNATGNYTNIAEVTASSLPDPDSTPNNGVTTEDDYGSVTVTPTNLAADLSLTKTIVGGNTTPLVGSEVSFDIIVTNSGPQDATGVQVTDLLPSGFTYTRSSISTGTYDAITGIWNVGGLVNGKSETLTISGTVNATGNYTNIAEVTASSLPDPDSTPNNGVTTEDDYGSVIVTPTSLSADLALTKTIVGGNTSPSYFTSVTFQITVNNKGPQDAGKVQVIDKLPSGYTYVVFSSTSGVYNEVTGIWDVGAIASGASETLLITAIVNTTGDYRNTAEVFSSDLPDPNSTPNNGVVTEDDISSVILTPVNTIADLSIEKLVVDDMLTPLVGSQITFQITLMNSGPNIATGVEVKDLLPPGYTFVFYNASSGSYNRLTGIWNPGIVLPNSSQTLLINVLVNAPTGAANEYLNITEVTAADDFDPDSTPNNGITTEDDYDSISVTPIIVMADLSVEKTIIGNQKPNVGDIVTFQVRVRNDGPGNATGVEVKDLLPSGFAYMMHSATSGTYTFADGRWNIGLILNNTEQILLINATVKPATGAANEYLNVAEVTASGLPDPDSTPNNGITTEDDYDSILVDVQMANLSLEKSVSNVKANVGEVVTFTIQVNNAGPVVATGVAIEDLLPIGYTNITNITGGGIYSGFRITWSNLQIPLSGTTLTFQATVETPNGLKDSDYVNTAQVTASDQFDPNSTPDNDDGDQSEDDEDNAAIETPKTDIAIIKTVDAIDPSIDALINFTITADNIGSLKATNVEVQDILPTGYQFVSAATSSGTFDSKTGIWKIPAVDVNSVQTLTLKVKVLDVKDYTNTAKLIALDQIDTNASNNQSSATIEPVCLKVHNEFSPNDDGVNDVFYIDCIANYPKNVLEIYNRWGNLIYTQQGYKNTWDGTADGSSKLLPVGTYFYILDLGDGTPKTSGWLYLKR
ncbi:PKD domain-containing protein [Flavobacterium poyangense]|uniref:PKD domain-containing protein n=1 Tax=Flavobacterium poyangense TaxID=2204302 RepID=UPI0014229DAF|nr:gliding motility-associated C-terminal domain-containing protein [Flavobacterium sp. JXAS1]